ncbi:TPA: FUSC family protein, partial [Legionella pneumophila]|nr:FUSC family protein [Legionella pneumophila]
VRKIDESNTEKINTLLFVEKLRGQFTEHYLPISISSENLKLDFKTSEHTKKRIDIFQETIWEIRRLVFALCISEFVLHSSTASEQHLQRFKLLMNKARTHFIQFEGPY